MPQLLLNGPTPSTIASPRSAPLARVRQGFAETLERAGSAFQRRPAVPGALALQNRFLHQQLAAADPKDVGKILAKELPSFGANFALSALDNTELGKAFAAVARVKPSTFATLISMVVAFVSPRRWRGARAVAAKVGKGGAHAVLARLGQEAPKALGGGASSTSGVEGYEPEPEADDGGPDTEPEPERNV